LINSLRLQGFKNFRDVTVPLGPLTVIVGTNASGKSNLRDAFRFLHGIARGYSLADIVGQKYVEGTLQWSGIRGGSREIASFGQSSFSLDALLTPVTPNRIVPVYDCHFRISVEVSQGIRPLRVVKESLYYIDELVYDSHPPSPSDRPIQEGQEYLRVRLGQDGQRRREDTEPFHSDQPVLSQFASRDGVSEELRTYARRAIQRIRSMRFLDLSPEAMKVPSLPGQPLGDRGENLSSVLQAICEDQSRKDAMTEWIRQLTPQDVVDFDFPADQTGRILMTLVESNGQRTSAYSASDGTLRFLAIMAALMAPDASQFYFFEEIDNGIHPTRLNLLLQLIEQLARQGEVQVVTTTHSPQLLAMLSPEAREHALLVYRFEDESEAHVHPILHIPTAREVLERQNLARLHESGWLENVVAFARKEDAHA
jgi:predicted ATPase